MHIMKVPKTAKWVRWTKWAKAIEWAATVVWAKPPSRRRMAEIVPWLDMYTRHRAWPNILDTRTWSNILDTRTWSNLLDFTRLDLVKYKEIVFKKH